jgi:trans-L-3-hydroxyproline dehydratase
MAAPRVFTSIDAHAAGAVVRLITGGIEPPSGRTLALKARALDRAHLGAFRSLLREPRGFDAVTIGVLCEPSSPDSDAAIVFRRTSGYVPLPVAPLVAAVTIAVERGLVRIRRDDALRVETGVGTLDVGFEREPGGGRVTRVRCAMPPAFVLAGGVPVDVGGRSVPVDVAWGGPFFAVVDSEAAGVALSRAALPDLRRMSRALAEAVSRTVSLTHPLPSGASGLGGVVFTGPPDRATAQLRGIAISPDGFADRAPSGAGLSAILAVIHAMGLAGEDEFVMEGLAGTMLAARIAGQTMVGEVPAVRVSIEGRAWITGQHEWRLDGDDPLGEGLDW